MSRKYLPKSGKIVTGVVYHIDVSDCGRAAQSPSPSLSPDGGKPGTAAGKQRIAPIGAPPPKRAKKQAEAGTSAAIPAGAKAAQAVPTFSFFAPHDAAAKGEGAPATAFAIYDTVAKGKAPDAASH